MATSTRLLLAVVFFYAAVLNMFVTRLFFQRRSLVRLDAPSTPSKRPEALLPPPRTPRIRLDAAADSQLAASCPASVPTVVVAVAPGKPGAPPDLRLFSTLRDMLRGFRLRVELVGAPAALTQTHRLWCHSAPLPCGVHELPASSGPLDLAVLTNPLLAIAPCLDDIVLLGSTLPLPPLFLRQLQRLTRPGKLTCLAAPSREAVAPASSRFAPCPALAYRLPRAYLWQTRDYPGQVAALAAERGLLAPPAPIVRT